ncbi:MAG TPA: NAD/NADP octopine/nopaline dehydrogenase family protein [Chthonomonadales bacterium]|nr:NAD/NADP octopine/nopaline dehydrogenase family protein [Chthonomonadales bacterium]
MTGTASPGSGLRFAVLGAGNGGLAMAGHLGLSGFRVRLYNRSPGRLQAVQQTGAVELIAAEGQQLPRGDGPIEVATTDIAEALEGEPIVMVVTPATAHAFMAEQCAPHLRDGQIVVLHPGRTGGALEFLSVARRHGCTAEFTVAEAQTLVYACRATNPAQVRIFGMKHSVPLAALPAHRTPEVVKALRPAYREFVPGDNVMKTSLDNIGAVFHPAATVLNCSRIESQRGEFEYYIEGISRSTATVLESLDAERVAVGAAMGFHCMTAREWLYMAYGAAGKSLFDAIRANQGYYGIQAPHTLDHRYLWEDVPMSLVPIASLGEHFEVPCPTTRAIVHLASLLHGADFWAIGRTVDSMGLRGLSLRQIRRFVMEGLPEESARPAQAVLQPASDAPAVADALQ